MEIKYPLIEPIELKCNVKTRLSAIKIHLTLYTFSNIFGKMPFLTLLNVSQNILKITIA